MMKATKLLFLSAMLLMSGACNSRPTETANPKQTVKQTTEQAAEQATATAPFGLDQCPQADRRLRVVLSRDADMNQVAVIYRNGDILQTIRDDEPLFTDWYDQPAETFVHYVDANYDGHTDIFLGLGTSRTYSTLLLWNPATQLFERYGNLGEPSLQNPVFAPDSKAIYTAGSNSAWEYVYTKEVWDDETLISIETLYYYDDPAEYNGLNGTNVRKYNLYGDGEQPLKATNDIRQLSKEWQKIVNRPRN